MTNDSSDDSATDNIFRSARRAVDLLSRSEKKNASVVLVLMCLSSMVDAACVGALPFYVKAISVPEEFGNAIGINHLSAGSAAAVGGLSLAGAFLLKLIASLTVYWTSSNTVENVRMRLASKLFSAYMLSPWQKHLNTNSSDLLRNVNNEVSRYSNQVLSPCLQLCLGLTQFSLTICVVAVVGGPIVIIPLLPVLLVVFAYGYLTKARLVSYGLIRQLQFKEGIKAIREGFSSLPESSVLGQEGIFIERYRESIRAMANVTVRSTFLTRANQPIVETSVIAGLVSVIGLAVFWGQGIDEIASLAVLLAAGSLRCKGSLGAISSSVSLIRHNTPAVSLLLEEFQNLDDSRILSRNAKAIEWKTLQIDIPHFRYDKASVDSLKRVRLDVKRGDRVGIVGTSGSGKSTLIGLMLGILKPTAGQISLDGRPLQKELANWQVSIGYVPQSIFLIDGTIRENIIFGRDERKPNEQLLEEVLQACQLRADVNRFTEGLGTEAGEAGRKLSGGQRQRIGLARALYGEPTILILDEFTSALDLDAEEKIIQMVEALPPHITIVCISHKRSSLRFCNHIFKITDGVLGRVGDGSRFSHKQCEQSSG